MTSYKLQTVADAQQLKSTYTDKIDMSKGQKEKYIKLYSKTENEADKTISRARVSIINENIDHLSVKVQTCRRIIQNFAKGEKEDIVIQERIKKSIANKKNKVFSK